MIAEGSRHQPVRPSGATTGRRASQEREARSLDLVQRVIMSTLLGVVFGSFATALALYLAIEGDTVGARGSIVGPWVMTGVLGLATAAGVLVINRRRVLSPWLLVGLVPMAATAYWIL